MSRLGVPCDRKETVPARLVLNPAIVLDQAMLKIVAEVLQNEPRLEGVTIVMKQESEFYNAVAEDTIEILASKAQDGNGGELRELLERVSTVAIGKFTLKDTQPERLIRHALEIITEAKLLQ